MMNCKKAAELASVAMDRKLSLLERVRLYIHTVLCRCCKCYCEQLDFLRCCAENMCEDKEPRHRLCDKSKEEIKEALKRCGDSE